MEVLYAIGWGFVLIASVMFADRVSGYMVLCDMFPEGKRWYHYLLHIFSFALFAVVVLHHPFK